MLLRVPWASICGGSKPKHVKTQRLECRLKLKEVMLIMFTYPAHSDNLTPFPSCKAPLKSVAQPSSGALLQGFHVLEARDVPGFVDLNMVEVYFYHLIGSPWVQSLHWTRWNFTKMLQETQNMFLPFDSSVAAFQILSCRKLGGNNYPQAGPRSKHGAQNCHLGQVPVANGNLLLHQCLMFSVLTSQ